MRFLTLSASTLLAACLFATQVASAKIVPSTYNSIDVHVSNQSHTCAWVTVYYRRFSTWSIAGGGSGNLHAGAQRMFNVSTPIGTARIKVRAQFKDTNCSGRDIGDVESAMSGEVKIPMSGRGSVRSALSSVRTGLGNKFSFRVSTPH